MGGTLKVKRMMKRAKARGEEKCICDLVFKDTQVSDLKKMKTKTKK
jgi:hypothetical protein